MPHLAPALWPKPGLSGYAESMPYPHTIRLRGPWSVEPLARSTAVDGQMIERSDHLPAACRGTVPSDWGDNLGREFRGRVRYRRSFNLPGTLDSHERVWLVVEGADARGSLTLNGIHLGEIHGYALWASFEVTSLLGSRNEVALEVELPAALPDSEAPLRPGRDRMPGGPVGEVRLEVRSQWFIEPLAIWSLPMQKQFAVRGQVDGEAEAPLAVVINGCERELTYVEVQSGATFETIFAADDFPCWTPDSPTLSPLEVKLVAGGSAAWQTVRQTSIRSAVAPEQASYLDQILSDVAYGEFDANGTAVIQHLPPQWADFVAPRLAHHPSIAAWSAGVQRPPAGTLDFGREWI